MNVNLILRDGKFYRGREEVAPEIGNREQIALLQAKEKELEKIEKNGSPVDYSIERVRADVEISFTCVCGKKITNNYDRFEFDSPDDLEGEVEAYLDGEEIDCDHCHREYKINDTKAELINNDKPE